MSDQENDRMREASDSINDPRPIVAFLYLLLRNELPAGRVEELVDDVIENPPHAGSSYTFTNGWVAQHARDIADRLEDS